MMANTNPITIEQLEALAAQYEAEDAAERARLLRLIRAYARIIGVREPEQFRAVPCWHGDEEGHFDNSYPPSQEYGDYTGPKLIKILKRRVEDVQTEGGFYYSWRRVTAYPGLYVRKDGMLWGSDETGTGHVGQFAAHPGDCSVDCTIEWDALDLDDVSTEDLQIAERELRARAFPLTQAAA